MRFWAVTGDASGIDGNYPGRFITPWREDESTVPDPTRFPFAPMTTRQFAIAVWAIYRWEVSWDASFFGPNYTLSVGGTFEVPPVALFPAVGEPAEIGPNEEYRMIAGFRYFASVDVPIPNQGSATSVATCTIGGTHQYSPPVGDTPQRFSAFVDFNYDLNLAPDAPPGSQESASFGIVANGSNGISALSIPTYDATAFPAYTSMVGAGVTVQGNSALVGPATVSCNVSIQPKYWWECRNAALEDPLYNRLTGAPLRSILAPPSTDPDGELIGFPSSLPGTRFIA